MNDRLTSMRRVLAVQDQLKRLAEWRLTEAETRRQELETEARALDGFIERSTLGDPVILAAMHHRRRVAGLDVSNRAEIEQAREATTQARSLHKLAERMIGTLKSEEDRQRERRDLERLIEESAGRAPPSGTSLP